MLHVLGSLTDPAWLQPPFAACMRLLDAQGRSPLRRCPACHRQAVALQRRPLATPSLPTLSRSPQCCCRGHLLRAALDQDLCVHVLLVPELLRCPSRPGGTLGALLAGVERDAGGADWDAQDVTLADVPLDVRIMICQLTCIPMQAVC